MPMHIRKRHHYKPLCSLNKCNIAQYSVVKHVTEINVHSLNYFDPFQPSYCTAHCKVFFAVRFYLNLQVN